MENYVFDKLLSSAKNPTYIMNETRVLRGVVKQLAQLMVRGYDHHTGRATDEDGGVALKWRTEVSYNARTIKIVVMSANDHSDAPIGSIDWDADDWFTSDKLRDISHRQVSWALILSIYANEPFERVYELVTKDDVNRADTVAHDIQVLGSYIVGGETLTFDDRLSEYHHLDKAWHSIDKAIQSVRKY